MSKKMTRGEVQAMVMTKAIKDEAFRKELIANPKAAVAKAAGEGLPEELKNGSIEVLEEKTGKFYFVLPAVASDELSEADLEAVAGGGGGDKAFTSFKCVTYPASMGGTCAG